MRKIPVLDTVGDALSFLIENARTVFRLAWFPLLLVTVAHSLLAVAVLEAVSASPAGNLRIGEPARLAIQLLMPAIWLLGTAMVAAALCRLILFGDRRRGTYVLLSLGRTGLLLLVIPALTIAVAVLVVGSPIQLAFQEIALGRWPTPLLFGRIAAGIALFYVSIRLIPLYPDIVVKGRISLRRAFSLSRGNFWRLIGVQFFGYLQLVSVRWILGFVILVLIVFMLFFRISASSEPGSFRFVLRLAVVLWSILGYFFLLITTSLTISLACFAYKAMIGLKPREILVRDDRAR